LTREKVLVRIYVVEFPFDGYAFVCDSMEDSYSTALRAMRSYGLSNYFIIKVF
jgi:hypothetical protein